MKKTGLILGKFMPPHLGHIHLINFARNYVDTLIVLVEKIPNEPISSELRLKWMQRLFPDVQVHHFTEQNPQHPDETPQFWDIWQKSLQNFLNAVKVKPDYVFTSESYGPKLADILNAQHVMVDPCRDTVPVSATAIRKNPFEQWDYIPPFVREYFLKRICIFGPESTGKTTLALNLAKHFNTVCVPEYAREYLESKEMVLGKDEKIICFDDMEKIAKGQIAAEKALEKKANKILFSDTDIMTTSIWSKALFGKCSPWLTEEILKASSESYRYDLYLLLNVDVPWVKDNVRYFPERRIEFFDECKDALIKHNRPFVVISGTWEERLKQSIDAVNAVIK